MHRALPAIALLFITGCDTSVGGGSTQQIQGDALTLTTQTYTADDGGVASVRVDARGLRSFLVTAQGPEYVAVEQVVNPAGQIVMNYENWDCGQCRESLTNAIYADVDTVLNWPVREEDGRISDGTWTVKIGAYYTSNDGFLYWEPGARMEVAVHERKDDDLSRGDVKALIVYCQGLSNNNTAVSGVEDAVANWKQIWANYGLSLEARYESSSVSCELPYPGYGNPAPLEQAAAMSQGDEVIVIVGESIDGDTYSTYGVSGNIPGTLIETTRSATVVSWLANAGRDGQFSADDIALFGETLAHEVGHYFGLFHVAEQGWNAWDALGDTPNCSSTSNCESQLGDNLMFPYPVCSFGGSCTRQDQMTDAQSGVVHRYTGTW